MKTMRLFIFFIISFLLLLSSSCSNDNKYQGIWIGSYTIVDDDSFQFTLNRIFEFTEDSLFIKELNIYDASPIKSFSYAIDGNSLIADNDTLVIEKISDDSLVLMHYDESKYTYGFIKYIPQEPISKINIQNKAFVMKSETFIDTIDFVDSVKCLHFGNMKLNDWAVVNYKDIEVLLLEDFFSLPFTVSHNMDSIIILKNYFRGISDVELKIYDNKIDTVGLFDDWLYPNLDPNNIPPPPLPPWLCEENNYDGNVHLVIDRDSLNMIQFCCSRKNSWRFNSTKDFILIPDSLSYQKYRVLRIIENDSDNLVLKGNLLLKYYEESGVFKFGKRDNW